eukprot:TRINITY_DN1652_c0_g1_i3.p1 TRINITY_DN1652_c0_g1~~TRINITY_DN1652_c0_g1_i3.p1  ORF type:complete len:640 (-),score=183.31 TRINITY_DN1652_c0_g1_i3:18-1937(-)
MDKEEEEKPSIDEGNAAVEENTTLSFGEKLLRRQGWKGTGHGLSTTSIAEPLPSNEKSDTAGLGYNLPQSLIPRKIHSIDIHRFFPHSQSTTSISSSPATRSSCPQNLSQFLSDFLGPIISVSDPRPSYDLFCTTPLVHLLFATKDKLNHIDQRSFLVARKKANPYETIGSSIFVNRAAVKMANLDHLYKLTEDCLAQNKRLYFADVCAGPGGFTEYLIWRMKKKVRGWGFTLKGKDDWKLEKFNEESRVVGNKELFNPCYGVDGDGNILKTANIEHFAEQCIRESGDYKGVDLVTADGGAPFEGDENLQEEKMKQLILCQFLTPLFILKAHGTFVCKLFDIFTPFTCGLIYLFYLLFDSISIVLPHTSRPANSERYIICRGMKEERNTGLREEVKKYLVRVNEILNKMEDGKDLREIVDVKKMVEGESGEEFRSYIKTGNEKNVGVQIEALEDIIKYIEDRNLQSVDQGDVRKRCLEEWGLPLEDRFSWQRDRNDRREYNNHNNNNGYNNDYNNNYNNSHNNGYNNNHNNGYNNNYNNGYNNGYESNSNGRYNRNSWSGRRDNRGGGREREEGRYSSGGGRSRNSGGGGGNERRGEEREYENRRRSEGGAREYESRKRGREETEEDRERSSKRRKGDV